MRLENRIAIITGSAITRLQVKREMTQPYLRIFDDATAGLAWLLALMSMRSR